MPVYRDKRDQRWRFRFEHQGHRFSGSTTKANNTRRAAAELESELQRKLNRNEFVGDMPTVAEFAKRFLEHQATHTAQLTQRGQHVHLMRHVVPTLGTRPLNLIGKMQVDDLKRQWTENGAARRTINTRLDTLQRMLAVAAEWGFLTAAPKLKRLPTDHEEEARRFLDDAESAALIAAADDDWRSMVVIALRTGMRIGELRGLKWTDVNFEQRSIRIARTDPGRRDMKSNSPKSGKTRVVPLTNDALAAIEPLERTAAWVWPAMLWRGKRMTGARSASGCFQAIVRTAKAAGLKGIGWHTLRHTYASALVMRGVELRAVQELLGHANIKQTEVYAHLAPGFAFHAAVAVLDFPLAPRQQALNTGKPTDGSDNESK